MNEYVDHQSSHDLNYFTQRRIQMNHLSKYFLSLFNQRSTLTFHSKQDFPSHYHHVHCFNISVFSILSMMVAFSLISTLSHARPKSEKSGDKNESLYFLGKFSVTVPSESSDAITTSSIGVGTFSDSGKSAYEKISAGASLLQLYTGFVYKGPSAAKDIKKELIQILKSEGINNIKDAIGKSM